MAASAKHSTSTIISHYTSRLGHCCTRVQNIASAIREPKQEDRNYKFLGSPYPLWLWLKYMYQNGPLVNGTKDKNLGNPSSLILSHTHFLGWNWDLGKNYIYCLARGKQRGNFANFPMPKAPAPLLQPACQRKDHQGSGQGLRAISESRVSKRAESLGP